MPEADTFILNMNRGNWKQFYYLQLLALPNTARWFPVDPDKRFVKLYKDCYTLLTALHHR